MKGKLHHVELYVKDLEVSKEFWQWLLTTLGYEVYQTWDRGISLKLEDTYLVFVQTEEKYKEAPYHRCGPGLNHLAFHGGSKTFVDEITEKLKEKGIRMLYEDQHPYAGGEGYYAVYFEDPDRIKVEIAV
ncbi:MAG: hypothetical protein GX829_05325 [Clostridium sp.]|nr:hypothetical protein [Clostridium sp.]